MLKQENLDTKSAVYIMKVIMKKWGSPLGEAQAYRWSYNKISGLGSSIGFDIFHSDAKENWIHLFTHHHLPQQYGTAWSIERIRIV